MKLQPRTYLDIVRDLLTALTGGTVAETHEVGPAGTDRVLFDARPVRRVSHLEGEIEGREGRRAYRFTERDFEAIPSDDNPAELVGVRFRDDGPRPAPASTVSVNYYPVRTRPTPLDDVNVGSVVRTLLETVSRELATQYEQLRLVYDSAFVASSTGTSLENVAALVGVQRLAQGHPIGRVRFARRPGSPGDVFVPIGTAVTDGKGNRYLTSDDASMLPTQGSVEVWVHGEAAQTEPVAAGALTVPERAIAGIDSVTNDEPTFRATEEERDDQLADRARRAIHGTGKGTLDAIRAGVEALPFVSAVTLTEHPDGVPGTLRIDVALTEDNAFNRSIVAGRVEEHRPAGIFVDVVHAGRSQLAFTVRLTLSGSFQPSSVVDEVQRGVSTRLGGVVSGLAPGGTLRRAQVIAQVLQDPRVVDASVDISLDGSPATGDLVVLPAGMAVRLEPSTGVRFEPPAFEAGAGAGGPLMVDVDAEMTVVLLDDSVDTATAEAALRTALGAVLANTPAGSSLTFEQVLAAVRETPSFVLVPAASVLQFQEEAGAFAELRQGDPPYTVAPSGSLRLRNVTAVEAT